MLGQLWWITSAALLGQLVLELSAEEDAGRGVECDAGEQFHLLAGSQRDVGSAPCVMWRQVDGAAYLPGHVLDEPEATTSFDRARGRCAELGKACVGVTRQPCSAAVPWLYSLRAGVPALPSPLGETSWLMEPCALGVEPLVDLAAGRQHMASEDGEWCVIGDEVRAFYAGRIEDAATSQLRDCSPEDAQCWFSARIKSFSQDGREVRVSWGDGDDDHTLLPLKRVLHERRRNWCTTTPHEMASYMPQQTAACEASNHPGLQSLCRKFVASVERVMLRWLAQWKQERCVQFLSTSHSRVACYAPFYAWYWTSTAAQAAECWSLQPQEGGGAVVNECLREHVWIALNSAKHVEQFDEIKKESTWLFEAVKNSELAMFFPWENLYQTPYFIGSGRPFGEFDPAIFLLPGDQYRYRASRDADTGWYDTSTGFLRPIAESLAQNFAAIKRDLHEKLMKAGESQWNCHSQPKYHDTLQPIMAQTGRCTFGIWGTGANFGREDVEDSCLLMPSLCDAVRPHFPTTDQPRYAEGMGIARLKPGGNVPVHRDPHRCFVFMCIAGCEDSQLQVGPSIYEYPVGVPISFDGSFDHGMWNNGTIDRVVVQITISAVEYDPSFETQRDSPFALITKNDRFRRKFNEE